MRQTLMEVLFGVNIREVIGTTVISVTDLVFDSRKVKRGNAFVAFKGTQTDGHKYIDMAVDRGAVAIIHEDNPENIHPGITYVKVSNSHKALGIMASNLYNSPSHHLKLVGVTGTNGKTTIVTLLHRLFRLSGYGCAKLSTISNSINEKEYDATHTTPDPIKLNAFLHEAVESGCEYAFMEVSSHAIDQYRIAGLNFSGGIFTNITHEHLDYHKTFKDYLETKKKFFDALPLHAFAIANHDDKNGSFMLQNTMARKLSYGLKGFADFKGKILESHFNGSLVSIQGQEIWIKLTGDYNVSNIMAVYGTALVLGLDKKDILVTLSELEPAEGRFNTLHAENNVSAIVDYAHTPDALENILSAINRMRTGNEQLITVIGAGGDRDTSKRPLMGNISAVQSTTVILTSDNPRSEDPEKIIEDMKKGIDPVNAKKVIAIVNRKEAIKTACTLAKAGDIILIAGKGHEKYQEIDGIRHPFDDKEILMEFLEIK